MAEHFATFDPCTMYDKYPDYISQGAMKYERDETNYEDDVYEQADYEILSKFNKKKLAREEAEEAAKGKISGENSSAAANGGCASK